MKSNELRIGNITKQGIVESISRHYITIENVGQYDAFSIEPIPLTEEWLLIFGFITSNNVNDDNFYLPASSTIALGKRNGGFMCWGIILQTVHQLQNFIFVLTGKELITK